MWGNGFVKIVIERAWRFLYPIYYKTQFKKSKHLAFFRTKSAFKEVTNIRNFENFPTDNISVCAEGVTLMPENVFKLFRILDKRAFFAPQSMAV